MNLFHEPTTGHLLRHPISGRLVNNIVTPGPMTFNVSRQASEITSFNDDNNTFLNWNPSISDQLLLQAYQSMIWNNPNSVWGQCAVHFNHIGIDTYSGQTLTRSQRAYQGLAGAVCYVQCAPAPERMRFIKTVTANGYAYSGANQYDFSSGRPWYGDPYVDYGATACFCVAPSGLTPQQVMGLTPQATIQIPGDASQFGIQLNSNAAHAMREGMENVYAWIPHFQLPPDFPDMTPPLPPLGRTGRQNGVSISFSVTITFGI